MEFTKAIPPLVKFEIVNVFENLSVFEKEREFVKFCYWIAQKKELISLFLHGFKNILRLCTYLFFISPTAHPSALIRCEQHWRLVKALRFGSRVSLLLTDQGSSNQVVSPSQSLPFICSCFSLSLSLVDVDAIGKLRK